ncbi:MFS transporter [Streptomyces sp. NPDC059866]|uniref:MFS transporter n=1 Tax=Streptomyces sp. NPDC059866 TaxID=3346978 RepID=UPI0036655E7B
MSGPITYKVLLGNREFNGLFAAHTVSVLGDVLTKIALSVLVYDRTGSALAAALTYALGFVPQVLTAALLSSVVDRFPARRVMLIGDAARMVCVLLMTVPGTSVAVLLCLVTASGALTPAFRAARQTMLPEIVGMEGYALARSMFSGTIQIGQTLGFGLGGLLLLLVTPRAALFLDAATFAFAIVVVLLTVRPRPATSAGRQESTGIIRATVQGNRMILTTPLLRRLLFLQWLPTAMVVMPEGLAAPYAEQLGGGPTAVGLLLAAPAVGTALGEAAVARFLGAERRARSVPALLLLAAAPLVCFAVEPALPWALALLLSGAGTAYALPLDQLFIESVPPHLRGRAMTLAGTGSITTQGTGLAIGGLVAEWISAPWVFAAGGLTALAAAAATGRTRPWRADPPTVMQTDPADQAIKDQPPQHSDK